MGIGENNEEIFRLNELGRVGKDCALGDRKGFTDDESNEGFSADNGKHHAEEVGEETVFYGLEGIGFFRAESIVLHQHEARNGFITEEEKDADDEGHNADGSAEDSEATALDEATILVGGIGGITPHKAGAGEEEDQGGDYSQHELHPEADIA